jgi:hypothetical protein
MWQRQVSGCILQLSPHFINGNRFHPLPGAIGVENDESDAFPDEFERLGERFIIPK